MGVVELGSLLQQPSLTGNRDGFDMIGALCRSVVILTEGGAEQSRKAGGRGREHAFPGAVPGSAPAEWTPRSPHYQMV
jgi:hypothetical protein